MNTGITSKRTRNNFVKTETDNISNKKVKIEEPLRYFLAEEKSSFIPNKILSFLQPKEWVAISKIDKKAHTQIKGKIASIQKEYQEAIIDNNIEAARILYNDDPTFLNRDEIKNEELVPAEMCNSGPVEHHSTNSYLNLTEGSLKFSQLASTSRKEECHGQTEENRQVIRAELYHAMKSKESYRKDCKKIDVLYMKNPFLKGDILNILKTSRPEDLYSFTDSEAVRSILKENPNNLCDKALIKALEELVSINKTNPDLGKLLPNPELIKILLDCGANSNYDKRQAISLAKELKFHGSQWNSIYLAVQKRYR